MDATGEVAQPDSADRFCVRVVVSCDHVGDEPTSITLDPAACDATQNAEGWAHAAVVGARTALKIAANPADCTIRHMEGIPSNATQILAAIATIRAVWNAIAFKAVAELDEALESSIAASLQAKAQGK